MTLHEAIIEVLESKPGKKATTQEIASEINSKKLYIRKDKQQLPAYQVMMRTKLAKGRYHHLFDFMEPDIVKLKNIYTLK